MRRNRDPKIPTRKEELFALYQKWTQKHFTHQPGSLPQPQSNNNVSEQHNEDDDMLYNNVICNDKNKKCNDLKYV